MTISENGERREESSPARMRFVDILPEAPRRVQRRAGHEVVRGPEVGIALVLGFFAIPLLWMVYATYPIVIVVAAVLGVCFWTYVRREYRRRDLVTFGVAATGWVSKIETRGGKWPGFVVGYHYRVPAEGDVGFVEYAATEFVEVGHFDHPPVGEAITVLYDHERPERSVLYRYAEYQVVGPPQEAVQVPGMDVVTDGAPLTGSGELAWPSSPRDRLVDLRRAGEDRMVLAPRPVFGWILAFLAVAVVGLWVVSPGMIFLLSPGLALIGILAGGVIIANPRWTILRDGTVTCRRAGRVVVTRTLAAGSIAAIQACFGGTYHEGGGRRGGKRRPYNTYQLNLILRTPVGDRVQLVHCDDPIWTRKAAQELAAFLGVPVVEHAMTQLDAHR